MNENIIVPPPPPLHPLLADRNRGRGRPDSNNRKKNSDKGVYCWVFCNYIIFFTVQKGRNIYRGGGGGGVVGGGGGGVGGKATFYNFFFFFWGGGGGGWGGYKSLFL